MTTTVPVENIQTTVAAYYGITVRAMLGRRRLHQYVRPRQMAIALTRDLTEHSLPVIGRLYGRDHSTVLHASRTVDRLRKNDRHLEADYQALLKLCVEATEVDDAALRAAALTAFDTLCAVMRRKVAKNPIWFFQTMVSKNG